MQIYFLKSWCSFIPSDIKNRQFDLQSQLNNEKNLEMTKLLSTFQTIDTSWIANK